MDKKVYDRSSSQIGKIVESGSEVRLYDKYNSQIGKMKQVGNEVRLYDKYNAEIAKFDGRATKDKSGREIGKGNLLLSIMYPLMDKVK